VAAVEQDAVALRSEIAELGGRGGRGPRSSVETDLQGRVEKLGKRLESELAAPPIDLAPALDDVRAELAALAARVDGTDAATAGDLETLMARFEERLDAEAGRTQEQIRAADDVLRAGLASLGERLAETESTYLEAAKPSAARSSGLTPRSSSTRLTTPQRPATRRRPSSSSRSRGRS
jgi:hypothetical protein